MPPPTTSLYSFAIDKSRNKTDLLLLETRADDPAHAHDDASSMMIDFHIDATSLTANNKFYLDFGDKKPFMFFNCYPVDTDPSRTSILRTPPRAQLDLNVPPDHQNHPNQDLHQDPKNSDQNPNTVTPSTCLTSLARPPVWGVVTVRASPHHNIPVGSQYLAQLPIGDRFLWPADKVIVDEANNELGGASSVDSRPGADDNSDGARDFILQRHSTHKVYNKFTYISPGSIMAGTTVKGAAGAQTSRSDKANLALVCFPGIMTGFGLYHTLLLNDFYRTRGGGSVSDSDRSTQRRVVVCSSASSKVSMALALFLKRDPTIQAQGGLVIIGYTSPDNLHFCQSLGVYDHVVPYDATLPSPTDLFSNHPSSSESPSMPASTIPPNPYILIEVSGRGHLVQSLLPLCCKVLCIGNASGTRDADSSFAKMGLMASLKMAATLLGVPRWITHYIPTKVELFLIMDVAEQLTHHWGPHKYQVEFEKATEVFVSWASHFIKLNKCETVQDISQAFKHVIGGRANPAEAVVLNVASAVQHLKSLE